MRKLILPKALLVAAVVLFSSEAIARPLPVSDVRESRITSRDGDRTEKVLARLKRFLRLIISSNDMIGPIP